MLLLVGEAPTNFGEPKLICGSDSWARTNDIGINSTALYQLSYIRTLRLDTLEVQLSVPSQPNFQSAPSLLSLACDITQYASPLCSMSYT